MSKTNTNMNKEKKNEYFRYCDDDCLNRDNLGRSATFPIKVAERVSL